jgi:hypothetical protein
MAEALLAQLSRVPEEQRAEQRQALWPEAQADGVAAALSL